MSKPTEMTNDTRLSVITKTHAMQLAVFLPQDILLSSFYLFSSLIKCFVLFLYGFSYSFLLSEVFTSVTAFYCSFSNTTVSSPSSTSS